MTMTMIDTLHIRDAWARLATNLGLVCLRLGQGRPAADVLPSLDLCQQASGVIDVLTRRMHPDEEGPVCALRPSPDREADLASRLWCKAIELERRADDLDALACDGDLEPARDVAALLREAAAVLRVRDVTQPCTKPCCDVAPLRDNPLTPDLTAKQLQFVRSVSDARAQAYPHGTEPWHPGEPDDHLAGFSTKEDRDAYQRHAPGPFERVRRATPPTREDLRRYAEEAARYHSVDVEMLAVQHLRGLVPQWRDLGPKPPPQEDEDEDDREWAMFRHARDEIRRYLDSESRRGDVWLLEDAVARREPPLLGERYDAFKDRAADLLAAAGWRVGYPVTDVPRLLAIAAERGRGAR